MKEKKPKVSICCLTYNHKDYIRNTIDSFLKQNCDFDFEIIIHDDCSTDGTINILKEYEHKHKHSITVIYEEENQYSKGKKIFPIIFNIARGKYIALCEGDDYWIDINKLKMQVEYMDKHPDCTMTFHNAQIYNQKTNDKSIFVPSTSFSSNFIKMNHCYNAGELELLGFIPTASFVCRSEHLKNLPSWYYSSPVGDLPIKLYVTSKGYAYYFDNIMSVYRTSTGISVMDKWKNFNIEKKLKLEYSLINLLKEFDKSTNYIYHSDLEISIDMRLVDIYCLTNNGKALKNKKLKYILKLIDKKKLTKIYLIMYFPFLTSFIKKILHKKR